jgi:jumonji domain-containing protein 7
MEALLFELTELSGNCLAVKCIDGANLDEIEFAKIVRERQPVILKRAVANRWLACREWSGDSLCERLCERQISVSMTPDGRADAIYDCSSRGAEFDREMFALPDTQQMTFQQFYNSVCNTTTTTAATANNDDSPVLYVQEQNSSFTKEFGVLRQDIDLCNDDADADDANRATNNPFWFSRRLFGEPDAVNFWAGTEKSVTSLHKDPYDNLYGVVMGTKHFLLFPPSDAALLPGKL